MSSIPVFADAHSRLHADIAIVRLIRAGIGADRISAVFPRRLAPNSVCCWLSNFHDIPLTASWPMAAAGLLGQLLKRGVRAGKLRGDLDRHGLDANLTDRLLEKVRAGRIVVCVHARGEIEATIASHIFLHVGAEDLTCAIGDLAVSPWEARVPVPQWNSMAA